MVEEAGVGQGRREDTGEGTNSTLRPWVLSPLLPTSLLGNFLEGNRHLEYNHSTSCHTHHHPTPFESCCPWMAFLLPGMDRCHIPALQAEKAGSGQELVVFTKT